MTRLEAEEYVRSCGEDEGPDGDGDLLAELFFALYERLPDDDDDDVWSLCCSAVAAVDQPADPYAFCRRV